MAKLVILKLGEGSFEQGFPVTLQIGEEGTRPAIETTGKLPPAPDLPLCYRNWQSSYRQLGLRSRLSAPPVQVTNVSLNQDCSSTAQHLRTTFNNWLRAEEFRAVREKWLEWLIPSDEVRVILQVENKDLQRLPWHLWDVLERYPKVELGLSAPVYESIPPLPATAGVRILAILGNSEGIDVQADRVLLEQLPTAEVSFLVEPTRKELTDRLWGSAWDILFFAGHSSSQGADETGQMFLNPTDSLTISELRYALRKSVERGLKLAIFNSCDGLGLARELADLQIPQMIVMREPVPDRVAQEFLKYFLEAFAHGEGFYLAVRQARERLQGLEDQFPCATWLPVIYQNPAEVPPTWQMLTGQPSVSPPEEPIQPTVRLKRKPLWALGASLIVTALLMGVRYVGMLQPLELQAFDQLVRLRPSEKPDSRLLVVTVTEDDVQAQPANERRGSLSDKTLDRLLKTLNAYQPRVIGLDIYRDYAVSPDYPSLEQQLRQSDRLVAVCKVSDPTSDNPGIAPPPELRQEYLGFSDFVVDANNVVRRHLLSLKPPPSSRCTTPYAFSVQLSLQYLADQGVTLEFMPDSTWKLGKAVFKPLESHTGGYQGIDAWGHQILLNYRSPRFPEFVAEKVTVKQVLSGQLSAEAVKDRVVLIGTTAESFRDYSSTPYASEQGTYREIPGVILQAQMVSQLLSAALDRRPIWSTWPLWQEIVWVWMWSAVGGILALYLRPPRWGLASGVAIALLSGSCFGLLLLFGYWVPLVPPAIALLICGGSLMLYRTSRSRQPVLKPHQE